MDQHLSAEALTELADELAELIDAEALGPPGSALDTGVQQLLLDTKKTLNNIVFGQ